MAQPAGGAAEAGQKAAETRHHTDMQATPKLLLLLPPLLLLCTTGEAQQPPNAAATAPPAPLKQYYIAAVEIGWDYIHWEDGDAESEQRQKLKDVPQKYIKAVYREYTDGTYTVPKPRPPWIGIQGPVILTKAGDKVAVHFKNLASQPYSISPVGITYWKQSEGAGYDDSTAGQEKDDDAVAPGGYYEYLWDISAKDGPTTSDPECLTYSYSSQVDTVRDANSGLIGALLVCKSSALTEKGERRNQAFVLLFAVFDESKSWYGEIGERRRERFQKRNTLREYHTINGYVNSTLPGLTMCQGRSHVFWHLIGMGTTPAIHSIQFQDHTLQVVNHRKATMEVTPMTFITAEMKPATLGRFLISCQIHAHQHDGMRGFFTVEDCPEPPDLRNAKHDEGYSDQDYDDMYNTIIYMPRKPQLQVRTSRGQHSVTLEHYIAAEEVTWDYAHHLTPTDSELHSEYLPASPHHLDYRYKKVVYVEYTDGSFTQRKNPDRTLLGPLLKGKVSDQFHIVFKNLASHPFNIYPIGLTKIEPLQKSSNAAEKDLRSMGVPPNGTFSYKWELTTDDGPLEGDQPCLTQLYQSTVSPERDLASGLVGTLLICRYDALDVTGRLLGPDQEWNLTFAVFDENRSWYAEENFRKSTQDSVNTTNPEFYNSNVIYSVNGVMFGGRQFVMCQTDVTYWHVANVGTQSDFLSIYFTGNLFQDNGLYKSVLTLFPMMGMTVTMEMELKGEWEISAFDGSLKSRGMSIHYTVRSCEGDLPLVDRDEEDEDISDYFDNFLGPRSSRPQNFTALVKVCKKLLPNNKTQTVIVHSQNDTNSSDSGTGDEYLGCQLKKVRVTSQEGDNATSVSDEGIPDDILTKIEKDGKWKAALNESEPEEEGGGRQRREAAAGNWTDEGSGDSKDGETNLETEGEASANTTDAEMESEKKDTMPEEKNMTKDGVEENNEILLDRQPQLITKVSQRESQEIDHNFVHANHIEADLEAQTLDLLDLDSNYTAVDYNATQIEFSGEYDDYSQEVNLTTRNTLATGFLDPRSGNRYHHYYIAAEEITWDYGIRKPAQLIKPREMRRGMRKFLMRYKKVVFRAYKDKNFQEPAGRGEVEEHLGLMGPLIRAEVGDVLTVMFKNRASRPYSFHLQGVYDLSQGAGVPQTPNAFAPSGAPGEPVDPGEARTYNWKVTRTQGPTDKEFDCKAGAYYSTVDKEKDLHSGLIGPLIICKPKILWTGQHTHQNVQDFALLFHTFDETKSWYLEENLKQYCTPPCYANPEDPWYHTSNKFAAINGYVAETLPGLLVPQHQLVRWHLLNVGSDGEYHAVHFHGLPFTVHMEAEHRMGVYNLFPGVFGTVEMRPPTVGTWLVECTVGDHQLAGMRAKLLIYNPECIFPLGMKSGRIQDSQITASDYVGSWEPRLGRLHQSGYINAWMGRNLQSWLQVDLLKPMLLHGVQTQGVRSHLRDKYISLFTVSYSLDQDKWITYRENNTVDIKIFGGNLESSKVKENHFPVPFVAQYIRIHPFTFMQRPALRLELLGCDLNSCAFPLGLQKKLVNDAFKASSTYSFMLRKWSASLARLHQEGSTNAWRPSTNNPHEWLQVNLGAVKRITGVVTQGAHSMLKQMMVTEFSVTFSQNNQSWSSVLEENSHTEKIFIGNSDPDEEVLNVFDPPLFGRYLRIHPRGWINDIALRLEVLGCDTQQWP